MFNFFAAAFFTLGGLSNLDRLEDLDNSTASSSLLLYREALSEFNSCAMEVLPAQPMLLLEDELTGMILGHEE